MTSFSPPSARTEVRRGADRATYDPSAIRSILASGLVAHVGVTTDDGPIVLPMAYGVAEDRILLHGSVANAMMRAGTELDVCVTVTVVDGLVVARTPFHNSMNYRCVVIRGTASKVEEPKAKLAALKAINDHIALLWDITRRPNEAELKRTLVLAVPLNEASAKIRHGDPVDDPDDVAGRHWAGVLPLTSMWGDPVPAADLKAGIEIPAAIALLAGTNAHPQSLPYETDP
ncbi:MAG: pyridoxamine 5'-phosphate oxidase family protein [Acidimicrobiia bacterium]|nr:pyridoxamine 5'-phosphate oxidase family protein [Acidimicrobiia bacterium]